MNQGGLRLKEIFKISKDNKPLVSIITIVFNGDKFLETTINSVLSQTYSNIEYIIVDGGSTDRSIEIIKKHENSIDYWISERDNGIADAFNKGIALSRGEIIGILNADDWYEADAVQTIISNLKPYPAIYSGHMKLYNIDGNQFIKLHKTRPDRLSQTMRVAHPSTFVHRNVYSSVGNFSLEYKIAMDYDFLLRVRSYPFEIITINKVLSNMRLGGISANIYKVLREELKIKNRYIGNKIQHIIWFVFFSLFHFLKNTITSLLFKFKNNA